MGLPSADGRLGLRILKDLLKGGSILGALSAMREGLGDAFQIKFAGFKPVVLSGPKHGRRILVKERDKFAWRNESDPVTSLLRHGFLVVDDEEHDKLRQIIEPALTRKHVHDHVAMMVGYSEQVMSRWPTEGTVDMLVEMRKVSLLILIKSLFGVDITDRMESLWPHVLGVIKYVSPGPWIVLPWKKRFGFKRNIREMDSFLFETIQSARNTTGERSEPTLLDDLISAGLNDDTIRDQMLTLLIAGHDTNTAHLAWTLYELGAHTDTKSKVVEEVTSILGSDRPSKESIDRLEYLGMVINESLRLHPPIHVSNRKSKCPFHVNGSTVPENTRTMFSIYLTQREGEHWDQPDTFMPERFESGNKRTPFSFLPFGGGPRNCIGAIYAQVEAKVVLACVLQSFEIELAEKNVGEHMGATLEPKPGVTMSVRKRMPQLS
ncbi:MAG: cytochrome P450 [Rhodothermales bacterium]|nr:cytochrome P450 [Rhodothermales bacterium]